VERTSYLDPSTTMYPILALLVTAAAGFGGYLMAKRFVGRRLRFVDAVRSPWAPWLCGAVAAVLASPLTLLPVIGSTTALVFGIGVGLGTASGVRSIRRGEPVERQLLP
jgi:hypothetical protein